MYGFGRKVRARAITKRLPLKENSFKRLLSQVNEKEIVVSRLYETHVKPSSEHQYPKRIKPARNAHNLSLNSKQSTIIYRAEIQKIKTNELCYAYLSRQQVESLYTIQRPTPEIVPIDPKPKESEKNQK
jgi:hypothetical protein